MKRWMAWFFGTVTLRIKGEQPEEVLNLCAREGLFLWRMLRTDAMTLELVAPARRWRALCTLAEGAGYETELCRRQGLPFFLLGFRRRYALLIGLALALAFFVLGARTVLTFDIKGNETVTEEEILGQLRLCGVSVGTYGPGIPIRVVENRMMLAMNELSYFSLNLYGTRAEIIVRERQQAPELRQETVAANVVAAADGVITHMESWVGDACFQVGEAVCKGDILISGCMAMDTPTPTETELPPMLVHAEGEVLARTWRRLTAEIPLTAQTKAYTGEEISRYSLSFMGKRVKFYQNGGIPYENYDTITESKAWTPLKGSVLPIVLSREIYRAYERSEASIAQAQAETLLKERLLEALKAQLDQGEILQTDYATQRQGDTLQVTLLAQCREQIGRVVPMDTDEKAVGPRHPGKTSRRRPVKGGAADQKAARRFLDPVGYS